MKISTLSTSLLFLLPSFTSALPAFPGAGGFGAEAAGGRKGSIYVVSNLADSGAGSLRDALSKSNRIIVFSVAGVIKIASRIVVPPRTTILGQTAPGGGITTYGDGWSFSNADDSIVRYIRIRMGKIGTSGKDAVTIAEGENMIFDHLSVSWGRDETFSISGTASNITVQDTIIGQGLSPHSCGGLMQTDGGVSLLRNLYIDNKTRNPKVKGVNEFVNNVVYNWGGGGAYIAGDSNGASAANIIGNYFISGPDTSATAFTRGNANFVGFVNGNFYDSNRNGALDGVSPNAVSSNYGGIKITTTAFKYPGSTSKMTAQEAVKHVSSKVGTSLARDSIDTRLVAELSSFGKLGQLVTDEKAAPMNGPGVIAAATRGVDTDGDGIPDTVEVARGTDPRVADSMKVGKDGYTNVEAWANSLVA